MNSKHRRTLSAVFADRQVGILDWSDIDALLVAAGCRRIEGAGSRVRFEAAGVVATFHRPHPGREAKRYQVRDVREFLAKIGVGP